MVGYIAASVYMWQSYKANTESFRQTKIAVRSALKPTTTAVAHNQKALKNATVKLARSESGCQPAWWIAWQAAIPPVGSMVSECKANAKKEAKLYIRLSEINQFLADEQAIADIFSLVPASSKALSATTWDTTIKSWTQVASDLKSYKASTVYEPVLSNLRSQTAKVVKAWNELKAADKKESKSAYEGAYDSLDQAITGLAGASDTSDEALALLLKKASTLADTL